MILRNELIAPDVRLGVMQMELAPSELRSMKNQRQAVGQLIRVMTGCDDVKIEHNSAGKPLLDGMNISISHTRGFVAVIMSESKSVGVDIEYESNRVDNVASRFIREDEDSSSHAVRLITWSAKETLYKLFSEHHLGYFDARVLPFDTNAGSGILKADVLPMNLSDVNVFWQLTSDFVLTYSYL